MISISPKSKLLAVGSAYFIENAVSDAVKSAAEEGADIYKLSGSELSYTALRDAVSIPSLFSTFTFIVLRRAEDLKRGEKEWGLEKAAELLNASDAAYIVTVSEEKSAEFLKSGLKGAQILQEDSSETGKVREVIRLFTSEGLELNEQAAKKLGESVDWDFVHIKSEASKWALFLHGKKASAHEILNIFAQEASDGDIWKFLRFFMLKRKGECLKMLADFKDREGESRTLFFRLLDNLTVLYFRLAHPKSQYIKSRFRPNAYYAITKTADESAALWQEEGVKRLISLLRQLQLDMVTGKSIRGSEWTDMLLKLVIAA